MTYAKIDSFRYFLGMDAEFEHYMSTIERTRINKAAENWYADTTAPKPVSNNTKNEAKTPRDPKAGSRLSFYILIDPKTRQDDSELFKQTTEWAKRLMVALYGNQEFFIKAGQENPSFMDLILESLERAGGNLLTGKQKLTDTAQLSNLHLDPSVAETFYHMLKGCSTGQPKAKQAPAIEREFNVKMPDDPESDEDEDAKAEASEYSKDDYDSLLNYITLRNTTKIRVYLASKPLLTAIVGQPSVADSIVEARQGLYRAVMNGSLSTADAKSQLADLFKGYINNFDDKYLDFTVSKTNPAKYK